MKRLTEISILCSLILLTTIACKKEASKPSQTNNALNTRLDKSIHDLVLPYMAKKNKAGLSIGILRNDSLFHYGYGTLNKDEAKIPDINTVFEIGSITKTFTAALLLNYLKAHGLTVNKPINSLLPVDVPLLTKEGSTVTIKTVLNHTSGLPRLPDDFRIVDERNPYVGYDSTKIYNYLKTLPLKSTPNSRFEYSNLGMAIAGLLVERNTGKSYEDNLQQVIAQPLNLKSTTSILPASINLATGYNETGNPTPYWTLDGFIGAGAIYSSVHDLLLYSQAQIHTSNTNLSGIFTTQHQQTFQEGGLGVGLGWLLVSVNGVECLFHDGGMGGFRSFILISVSKKTAIVVLANNADEDVAELAQRISADIIK